MVFFIMTDSNSRSYQTANVRAGNVYVLWEFANLVNLVLVCRHRRVVKWAQYTTRSLHRCVFGAVVAKSL